MRVPGRVGSVAGACGLSCSAAHGISVPRPGTEPELPALEGRISITGPPGNSLLAPFKGMMERGLKRLTEVLRLQLCHQGPATMHSSSRHFSWGERNPLLGVRWHQEQPLPRVKSQTLAEMGGISWEREPSQSQSLDEPAGPYLSTPKNPF